MKFKFNKSETLILVALEEECPRGLLSEWRAEYSGVGKVNAIISLSKAVSQERPKSLLRNGFA